MTRAEIASLEAYPLRFDLPDDLLRRMLHGGERKYFQEGYEQAEKDLALTLAQIVKLDNIIMNMVGEGYNDGYKTRPFYEEVLKRFNDESKS